LKNGLKRKEEFYYGVSFLSQSSRFVLVNHAVEKIELGSSNKLRTINLK